MSETTAVRTGAAHSLVRALVVALAAAGWVYAAVLLWRTQVPTDLHLPRLDPNQYFSAAELRRTDHFERFLRVDWVLSLVAALATLGVMAVRGPRIARGLPLGRVGSAIVLGLVTLTALFFAELPFAVAARWWERRYDLTRGSWVRWLFEPWAQLLSEAVFAVLAIAIVVALAGRFPRGWWVAVAPIFTGLALLLALASGPIAGLGTHGLRSDRLRADARRLERRIGVEGTPIRVEKVSDTTKLVNAETVGLGPSARVILWDTLLDGRFGDGEIRVVMAHELGHVARRHVWKGVAWFGLFAVPGLFLIAAVTRRRGGLGDPGVLPFGLLALTVLQLVLLPAENVVSRRYEAEADWVALRTTQDPRSARAIFRRFSSVDLAQPSPPTWDYVLLENHPTVMQRIAMVEAFRNRRAEASPAGS